MSCEGCYSSERGKQEALNQIRIKAKQYAVKNECIVIIYHINPFEVAFMEAEKAGGIAALEYITPYA